MKVISGIYKGRNIEGFSLDGTRPTMERVKESLFATIQDYIKEGIILDLFSGSGNLGIEALSEGANYAYLCDHNPKAIQTIEKNIREIGIKNAKVYKMDYQKCIKILSEEKKKIDIIFLDPPYNTDYIEKSIELIHQYQILSSGGIIVCESNSLDRIIYKDLYKCVKKKNMEINI